MDQNPLFRKKYGSFRRFFRMLWKAPLPFLWILAYIGVSFALTHVGVSATEYSARLFAGDVDAVSVVIPGASRASQVTENVKAAELPPLTQEQMRAAEEIYNRLLKETIHPQW